MDDLHKRTWIQERKKAKEEERAAKEAVCVCVCVCVLQCIQCVCDVLCFAIITDSSEASTRQNGKRVTEKSS